MRKRVGVFTKLAVLVLVVYAAFSLVNLHGQIVSARETLADLQGAVAQQTFQNAVLEHEIENSEDPEVIERIARSQHNLIRPGERIFYGVVN